jgi:hypothetical protein
MAEEMVRIASSMPKKLHHDLRVWCARHDKTIQDVIAASIALFLEQQAEKELAGK